MQRSDVFCAEESWQKFILERYYIQIHYSKLTSETVFLISLSLPYMHVCENLSYMPMSRSRKCYADDTSKHSIHIYLNFLLRKRNQSTVS